jgi:hypothetical protein
VGETLTTAYQADVKLLLHARVIDTTDEERRAA